MPMVDPIKCVVHTQQAGDFNEFNEWEEGITVARDIYLDVQPGGRFGGVTYHGDENINTPEGVKQSMYLLTVYHDYTQIPMGKMDVLEHKGRYFRMLSVDARDESGYYHYIFEESKTWVPNP